MASLIEELINVLEQEYSAYEELNVASTDKTKYIISNDLEKLQEANIREQQVVDAVGALGGKRGRILNEIATVLNISPNNVNIAQIITLISKQPEFQKPLIDVYDRMKDIVVKVKDTNEHNRELLESALEMTEISINLLQSVNQAPETANYGKGSYSGDTLGVGVSMFDTKQ